ncbi:MAG: glutamine--fructose-6-phosphate transaminase (isomerizing) [Deltaproteobacteria bacterium]|nr:glutamine--fructose-6-phosphate transaminase (isomerizing) [Deltaproteobacteria bacterium]
MCGIMGYIGYRDARNILIDGLKRLEYRGYDSSGIAIFDGKKLRIARAVGKIAALESLLEKENIKGSMGIGHTRWATHGRPTENNAHPHLVNGVAVVHNGIIENYSELKNELTKKGSIFKSETDTEVISHLIGANLQNDVNLFESVLLAIKRLEGAFAIAVISEKEREYFVVAKNFSPLIIGIGEGENFVASDIPALLPYTRRVIMLSENELAKIYKDRVEIYNISGEKKTEIEIKLIDMSPAVAEKEGHKHFMHKEIFESPKVFADTMLGRIDRERGEFLSEEISLDPNKLNRIVIVACGTSYHAGLLGKYYFEQISKIPAEAEFASEFRYRNPVLKENDLAIFISQSGETADTLGALKDIKEKGIRTLAVCNVMNSSIARMADDVIYTRAGIEIGVASTKAFIAQVEVLLMLAISFASKKRILSNEHRKIFVNEFYRMPFLLKETLSTESYIKDVASRFVRSKDFIYLGRGINFPVALEGALKLKEISYIHAEGYAAGEMKHGPIALIDEDVPVLVIANRGSNLKKIISNILEAKSRGGILIGIITKGDEETRRLLDFAIEVEETDEFFQPFVNSLPLQLLAYHIADMKGTDVDQPRNLAKSVTVE